MLPDADAAFSADPEGLALAARLNARLPPAVRVLAVQRANKKFNARRAATDRAYDFYLPAGARGRLGGREWGAMWAAWGEWMGGCDPSHFVGSAC